MAKSIAYIVKSMCGVAWFALAIGTVWTGQCLAADGTSSEQAMTNADVDALLAKQPDIPRGVVYKKPSPDAERQAVDLLIAHPLLSGGRKFVADTIFGSRVICGPGIWTKIKDDAEMKKIVKGVAIFKVPNATGMQVSLGKLFQSKEEVEAFWRDFVNKYPASKSTIRRPTPGEFGVYWAMITFDITEPLFVVESKDASILVQFVGHTAGGTPRALKMHILWIDDYKNIRLVRSPSK